MIDPHRGGNATIIHTFPEALSLAAITEYKHDLFAVISGNFSPSTGNTGPGSWAVWSVDLRGVRLGEDNELLSLPKVSKIANIPQARFLGGMALLSEKQSTLLVGDLAGGDILSEIR